MGWRDDQATEKQLDYLSGMRLDLGITDGVVPKTKGEAYDAIRALVSRHQRFLVERAETAGLPTNPLDDDFVMEGMDCYGSLDDGHDDGPGSFMDYGDN